MLEFVYCFVYRVFRRIYWKLRPCPIAKNVLDLVGKTPMVELQSLSEITGCRVLAKLEYMNPGGSPKDRIVLHWFRNVVLAKNTSETMDDPLEVDSDKSRWNGLEIVEGSSGSTGISLSFICSIYGIPCTIFIPSDQSEEKMRWMRLFGASVVRVPPAAFSSPEHYIKKAAKYAAEDPRRMFFDQFENVCNYQAHFETTGPEIWDQTSGTVDALVLSAGTAGTLAGTTTFLRSQNPEMQVFVADPPGSGIKNWIRYNTMYAPEDREGFRSRHQLNTIVQGVGLNRITHILSMIPSINNSYTIQDNETINMASFILHKEGIFIGSSAALNLVGVLHAAKSLPKNSTIVTILPDAGHRHWSTLWNTI